MTRGAAHAVVLAVMLVVVLLDLAGSPAIAGEETTSRPTQRGRQVLIATDDFSLAATASIQGDFAHYDQSAAPANNTRLSNSALLRGAHLGVRGTFLDNWDYRFDYDFTGAYPEGPAHIRVAYVQYNGWAPFVVAAGVQAAPLSLGGDSPGPRLLLPERAAATNVSRGIASGPGRRAVTFSYEGQKLFAAASYTADKLYATPSSGRQWALLGRLATLAYADSDVRVVLDAGGTYAVRPSEAAPSPESVTGITLSEYPEGRVGRERLVSTGRIDAAHVYEWSLESAAQWRNLYGQSGYYSYIVERRLGSFVPPAPRNVGFDGWYVEAGWVLTGERRAYSTSDMTFSTPVPVAPMPEGWGAFELAARYSYLNLDDRAGAAGAPTPPGGVRGGRQRIVSLGLNWYPIRQVRFTVEYQNIHVDRLDAAGADAGLRANAIALRSQLMF